MSEKRLVKVPAYAKLGKNNKYYALKRNMPYFSIDTDVKGSLVIGIPAEEPGMMEPDWAYDRYCAEGVLEKRQREEEEKRAADEAEAKRLQEEEEERKRNFGWTFIPRSQAWKDLNCYPANGMLAEKFFDESGLNPILTEVFGKERAFWIRLYAALLGAGKNRGLGFGCLNDFPMKDHMVFESSGHFSLRLWGKIEEEEIHSFLEKWIALQNPVHVSGLNCRSTITLYHDSSSDRYGDWFSSRLRTGTRHSEPYILYRDEDTDRLLAYEGRKYNIKGGFTMDSSYEEHTIHNSDYEQLRQASLDMYLETYHFMEINALKKMPTTVCMFTSVYPDQKALKKQLKALEDAPLQNGRRIIRWDGEYEGISGHWALLEIPEKREWMTESASTFLKQRKLILETMSYYDAVYEPYSEYFELEHDEDDEDFFGNMPFTVKAVKNSRKLFTQDAGRFLYFTNGEEIPDEKLIRMEWQQEDQQYLWNALMNHGETADLTEEFRNGMTGRDFALFLAQMYREWIYSHIKDMCNERFDVSHFLTKIQGISVSIDENAKAKLRDSEPEYLGWLERFGIRPEDLETYMDENFRNAKYLSDEYDKDGW